MFNLKVHCQIQAAMGVKAAKYTRLFLKCIELPITTDKVDCIVTHNSGSDPQGL